MEGCIFCRIISGEIPSNMVYTDEDIVAFRDINPQAPVHLLIVPRKHIPRVYDLPPGDYGLMGKMVEVANRLAREEGVTESGYRLVINCNRDADQEVFHFHMHLLGGRKMGWPPG